MSTDQSLLQKAKSDPKSEAWFKLLTIYEPLIVGWIVRAGIQNSDIGDVSQEVLQSLAKDLTKFDHNGRAGAFRNWLKTMTINRCRRYWDWKKRQLPFGQYDKHDSGISTLNQIEDPNSDLSKLWDEEHDSYVLRKVLQMVRHEFDDRTYQIFLKYGLEGEDAKSLADRFEVSIGQVYKAKFRVLERIRREVHDLISFPSESNELQRSSTDTPDTKPT